MDIALIILLLFLGAALIAAFKKGGIRLVLEGVKQTWRTMKSVWFRIALGMLLGGFIQTLIPSAAIAEWLGPDSGLKGILVGSYTGIILGGGPYMMMPIVASVYHSGAGAAPVISLLAGGILSIQVFITWFIPLLGMRIAASAYIIALIATPLIGLIGGLIFNVLTSA